MKLYRHVTANNVLLKEFPFARELSMEAYLIENPEILVLDDDELSDVNILDYEVPINKGRPSRKTDGRIDLLAQYGPETIAIIELKLGELNQSHLDQLCDYLNDKKVIKQLTGEKFDIENPKFIGILVGSDIEVGLSQTINTGYLINDEIPVAALTIKRYRGEDNNIYILTDTYFKNRSRSFDKTKYDFEGKQYGKGRLVLAILSKYVEDHPDVTFSDLEKVFPKKLQGSWGVFDTLDNAEEIVSQSNRKRHFIQPEEIIKLKDALIAVCSQWGSDNIGNIEKKATELGYDVKRI